MKIEKKNKITTNPFVAYDSDYELKGWEYIIPEGMEAEIKDGKIIVRQKESEDERILDWLITQLRNNYKGNYWATQAISYLEKKEQKPAEWSKVDERVIRDACCWIAEYAGFLMSENKDKAEMLWKLSEKLKSICPQPKVEWSEEDEKILEQVIDVVYDYCPDPVAKYKLKDWLTQRLKSLRPQQKQEWSEKEYGRLFDIEHYLDGTLQLSPDGRIACIDFIKSIRSSLQKQQKPVELSIDDVKRIVHIHREVLAEYPDRIMGSEENYKDTLMRFIENNKN